MSGRTLRLLEPVDWHPALVGDYPGQESVMHVGDGTHGPPVPMIFCWCPPTPPDQPFLMGSPPDEPKRFNNESQRAVPIPQGFWLAKHPVSQAQWQAVMGKKPSRFSSSTLELPVDSVSWDEARDFCQISGLRLPAEAEWEYACRAGTATPFGIGCGTHLNAQMANFDAAVPYGAGREAFPWTFRQRTLPAGSFPPNAWGLHDMHGQLWEWCDDCLGAGLRVLRGGSWYGIGGTARSAIRSGYPPANRSYYFGFRPCPSSTQSEGGARKKARSAARSAARDERNDDPEKQ